MALYIGYCSAVARSEVKCVDAINVKHNVNNKTEVFSADKHALIKLLRQKKWYCAKGLSRNFSASRRHYQD